MFCCANTILINDFTNSNILLQSRLCNIKYKKFSNLFYQSIFFWVPFKTQKSRHILKISSIFYKKYIITLRNSSKYETKSVYELRRLIWRKMDWLTTTAGSTICLFLKKSINSDLKSKNSGLKSISLSLKSRNSCLKSRNLNLKSRNSNLKSRNSNLKFRNIRHQRGY